MVSKSFMPALFVLLASGVLGGCAASDHDSGGTTGAGQQAAAATTPVGTFAPVPTARAAFDGVTGSATLTKAPGGGSDVSITLRGLKPNVSYLSHVHAGTCGESDPGGPHFKFDPNGPDTPPNEIHLSLTPNATGSASASAHSTRSVAPGAARSIVVHQDTATSPSGAPAENPKAAAGHEHHARPSTGTASAAGGHSHSQKIACAALRASAPTDAASSAAPPASGQSPQGGTLAIRVNANAPVGGVQKLAVRKGERVRFTVTSDQPEEVHVHAYDVIEAVSPATPARFDFPASIEGDFEVELERSGVQILSLRVNPQ